MSFIKRIFPVPPEVVYLHNEAWSQLSQEHRTLLSSIGVRKPVDLYYIVHKSKIGQFLFQGRPLCLPELEAYLTFREHTILLQIPRRSEKKQKSQVILFR